MPKTTTNLEMLSRNLERPRENMPGTVPDLLARLPQARADDKRAKFLADAVADSEPSTIIQLLR
jgi:hypothetical protein